MKREKNKRILLKTHIFLIILIFVYSAFAGVNKWSLRVGVKSTNYRDSYNFLGVSKNSLLEYDKKDLPEPPPSPSGLCLYFPHEDWSFQPGRYSSDFRPPILTTENYEFIVESGGETELTLFWLKIEAVPKIYTLTLRDLKRKISVDMREVSEYTYVCGKQSRNKFRVIVEKKNASL